MNQGIKNQFQLWCKNVAIDTDIAAELKAIANDDAKIEDAFYCGLVFGTGGLRGVIGAGTNRMNIYTVAKASQGLADYVRKKFPKGKRKIAVSYDSRIKSDLFAQKAASVFAANGIEVYIYSELMPTPCLSFAVRKLCCAAGIMITASHNPSGYNGYKVYGSDGCQVTTEAAKEIYTEIEKLDIFADVKTMEFDMGVDNGIIRYIPESIYTAFVGEVKKQSVLGENTTKRNAAIVYSPLNGTGLKPVLRTLKESGYSNIIVVREQEHPNGNFPTCPYPNPEIRDAMELSIAYAKRKQAALVLATDPDCDRVGVAVRSHNGEYVLLSGNETGVLLLDFICSRRIAAGTMPENPVLIKTIVTTDLGERIAERYGVRTVNVLTGFKYIGEQIGLLEAEGKEDNYIFGFEESCGYLTGSYVRDKDAVAGVFLICEMFAYYAGQYISLLDKLDELYREYGYYLNTLHTYEFEGSSGLIRIQEIMRAYREKALEFGKNKIIKTLDYSLGQDGLPKSDVLKFLLSNDCSVVVRPSGTEPKLKVYISVNAADKRRAEMIEKELRTSIDNFIASISNSGQLFGADYGSAKGKQGAS